MTFSQALELLKAGQAVSREGWNGKGMFIFLNKGSIDIESPNFKPDAKIDGIHQIYFEKGDIGTTTRLPNINMRAASGSTVTGWLASQTDMLAEDWDVLPATA